MANEVANRVAVSKRVGAPVDEVFAVLADPNRHASIDGSGMLRFAVGAEPVARVGDRFVLRMHNDEMGEYEMTNHVIEFERNRRIAWEPVMSAASRPDDQDAIDDPGRQVWGFEVEPDGPGSTLVTEFYDCARSPEWLQRAVKHGQRWVPDMKATLELLDQQCSAHLLRARPDQGS